MNDMDNFVFRYEVQNAGVVETAIARTEQLKGAQDGLNRSAAVTRDRLDDLGAAYKRAGSSAAGAGQAALQTGRVIQDFAQGGLGGILNNIEGLVTALGGGAGLAGALTLVGVAALLFKDRLAEAFNELRGDSNPIPKANDNLKAMKDRLDDVTKSLDGYKDRTKLSSDELKEFNRLTAEQVRLEKDMTAEKERRAAIEKALEDSDPTKRRAKQVQQAVSSMGGLGKIEGEFVAQEIARQQSALGADFTPDMVLQIKQDMRRRFGDALRGDMAATEELGFLAKSDKTGKIFGFNDAMRLASEEERKAQDRARQDAENRGAEARERNRDNKKADTLNAAADPGDRASKRQLDTMAREGLYGAQGSIPGGVDAMFNDAPAEGDPGLTAKFMGDNAQAHRNKAEIDRRKIEADRTMQEALRIQMETLQGLSEGGPPLFGPLGF